MTTFTSRSIRSNICQLVRPFGRFHPDVRRVYAAENLQAGVVAALTQNAGVAHVMLDERANLLTAFRRNRALRRPRCTDKQRCLISCSNAAARADAAAAATVPVCASTDFGITVNAQRTPVNPPFFEKLRIQSRTRARRESRRSNAELPDRRCTPRTRHRKAEAHRARARNRSTRQLRARCYRAGWIVWKTKINEIHMLPAAVPARNPFSAVHGRY